MKIENCSALIAEQISPGALASRLSFRRKALLSLPSAARTVDKPEKHGTVKCGKKSNGREIL